MPSKRSEGRRGANGVAPLPITDVLRYRLIVKRLAAQLGLLKK